MGDILEELPLSKEKMEQRYTAALASFAVKFPREHSREHIETAREEENRSEFQRDRDRIIHSKAFRRLMYKTQVFVNHEGDHYRTRLTHTLEVAQFARGICKSLALNEELAEAIALGHDLGHTPFGHAVERYLSTKLEEQGLGKFFHNEQSVRIVDSLEKRCKEYNGLNLTCEVREGILKHNSSKDRSGIYHKLDFDKVCSTLEGQIVNKVDTIAYICHDLQDGIMSGLVEDAIHKNPDFALKMTELKEVIAQLLGGRTEEIDFTRYSDTYFVTSLIHKLIMKITENSVVRLKTYSIHTCEDVREKAMQNIEIITFDNHTLEAFQRLKQIIYTSIYGLHTIKTMDEKAVKVISDIYEGLAGNPKLLPPDWYYRYLNCKADKAYDGAPEDKLRVICDYIATMTDRFALDEHERLFNPRIKI